MKSDNDLFKIGARLALHGQSFIEVLDDIKGTKLYNKKPKMLLNQLMKELEKDVSISGVFTEGQDVITNLSQKIDKIVDKELDDTIFELKDGK